jgi:hypothetical protein
VTFPKMNEFVVRAILKALDIKWSDSQVRGGKGRSWMVYDRQQQLS